MRIATLVAFTAIAFTAPAHADCLSDIKDVLNRSMTSGPYSLTVESPRMRATSDVVPPGNLHSTMEIGGKSQEVIVIDGKGWSKLAGAAWTEMPATAASQASATIGSTAAMDAAMSAPECLGPQTIDGRDLIAFKYDMTIGGVRAANQLFVDPATGLPAVIQSKISIGDRVSETKTTYRYDPAISISPPAM